MNPISTVRGPVPAGRLGTTLMHEHVFILNAEFQQNRTDWDEEERIADATAKLNEAAALGVETLVDVTVLGLGRYVPRLQRIAAATPLNIVVATGVYTYGDVPFWFHERRPARGRPETDPMIEFFVRDITEGIAGTGVRAGILKCATGERGVTPDIERILRAVARAHRATGVPLTTPTDAARRNGLDQQRIFAEEGVDLARVVIGHSGDTDDLDYLRRLMDAGSTIGMDRFGIDTLLPLERRVATVAALCAEGYADRMVLSHDAACWLDWFDPDRGEQLRAVLPDWHYRHIHEAVLPALSKLDVSPDDVGTMLVDNPRRLLTPVAPY
ncbi:MAG TPA: phosphotriesterase-related protein [Acidimicrobiia bacterium]|nr:phosphotriesterase-related protein [Acidimicrobiia bacterium]